VLESDDWGSIRTASRAAYDALLDLGYDLGQDSHSIDALETEADLRALFNVLDSVRDRRGRPACLTANMIVSNPDFGRIQESGFRRYYYVPLAETLSRSGRHPEVARLWSEGLERKLFVPQLHGREHVRWWEWMSALRSGSAEAVQAFRLGMCGVPGRASKERLAIHDLVYLPDAALEANGVDIDSMIREGADLFERQFGYRSLSAIAPNYCWTDRVETLWSEAGIRYIQGSVFQRVGDRERRRAHFLGQRGPAGGLYLIRNCFFEPASGGAGWVDRCLRDMAAAFLLRKPAVISCHRVNFIGSIVPDNRETGLRLLRELLNRIVRKWPDVAFVSSVELGHMIAHRLPSVDRMDGNAVLPRHA